MGQMIFDALLGNMSGNKGSADSGMNNFKLPSSKSNDQDITNLMSQYNIDGMQTLLDMLNPKPLDELSGQMQPLGGNDALSQLINVFIKASGR